MNVKQLITRFNRLKLDGADLSIEVRHEAKLSRLVTSVTITGSLASDYGPDDGIVYNGELHYRIEADRHHKTLTLWIEGWTNDEETDGGYPWFEVAYQGVEAFTEAEKIANILQCLVDIAQPTTPNPFDLVEFATNPGQSS